MIVLSQTQTRIQERAEVHARHPRAESHHYTTVVEDVTTNQMTSHAKPDSRYTLCRLSNSMPAGIATRNATLAKITNCTINLKTFKHCNSERHPPIGLKVHDLVAIRRGRQHLLALQPRGPPCQNCFQWHLQNCHQTSLEESCTNTATHANKMLRPSYTGPTLKLHDATVCPT